MLREWQNANNSIYNGLQLSVRKQTSHGVLFNVNYTYSHAIDNGSSWHDSATSAAGSAGGDGYSTDTNNPGLDRGNAMFDIRHRLVLNYVWQLPGQNMQGVLGKVIGGWSLNGIWSFQGGPHWSPYSRLQWSEQAFRNRCRLCEADITAELHQYWRRVDTGWPIPGRRSAEQQYSELLS